MSILQMLFAVAALINCYLCVRAALITQERLASYLFCAGASSLAFFVSYRELPWHFAAGSLLAMATAVLLSSGDLAEASKDLGESTITRRMRKRGAK